VDLLATAEPGDTAAATADDQAQIRIFPRLAPEWIVRSPALRDYVTGTPFGCIHHHSLWLRTLGYATAAAKKQGCPLVISPRGMMSGWAWRHRRWRKYLAGLFIHPGAFARAAGWHATSTEEADDIRALGFKQPVCVAPNGVPIPDEADIATARAAWHQLCPATQSRPVALFYSRFHRKKRVRELIELWNSAPRGDWLLLVVGTAEDYSASELAATAPANVAVFDGAGQPPPYGVASLFVLPSHSENFGLVIAEALAAGVPALVTDTTPWSGLVRESAGWCVSWENYGPALAAALATDRATLAAMGRRSREWMARDFSWGQAARLLHEFYLHLRHD
jgi:glycosyltransferase involved in cell wall biosynthesis